MTPLLRPDAPERGKRDAADRLRPLLRRAHERGAHLHIDMESMDSRDAVLELILELLAEEEFRAGPSAGLVLQGYLRDSPETLDTILAWLDGPAPSRAQPLTIRLVKGAYWDHELVQAAQHGWYDAGLRAQGRHRRELRAAHAPAARRAAGASGSRSPRTTCARSRTRSPTTG